MKDILKAFTAIAIPVLLFIFAVKCTVTEPTQISYTIDDSEFASLALTEITRPCGDSVKINAAGSGGCCDEGGHLVNIICTGSNSMDSIMVAAPDTCTVVVDCDGCTAVTDTIIVNAEELDLNCQIFQITPTSVLPTGICTDTVCLGDIVRWRLRAIPNIAGANYNWTSSWGGTGSTFQFNTQTVFNLGVGTHTASVDVEFNGCTKTLDYVLVIEPKVAIATVSDLDINLLCNIDNDLILVIDYLQSLECICNCDARLLVGWEFTVFNNTQNTSLAVVAGTNGIRCGDSENLEYIYDSLCENFRDRGTNVGDDITVTLTVDDLRLVDDDCDLDPTTTTLPLTEVYNFQWDGECCGCDWNPLCTANIFNSSGSTPVYSGATPPCDTIKVCPSDFQVQMCADTDVAGNYTYAWSAFSGTTQCLNVSLFSLPANYTVTITDDLGCSEVLEYVIDEEGPTIMSVNELTCGLEWVGSTCLFRTGDLFEIQCVGACICEVDLTSTTIEINSPLGNEVRTLPVGTLFCGTKLQQLVSGNGLLDPCNYQVGDIITTTSNFILDTQNATCTFSGPSSYTKNCTIQITQAIKDDCGC